MEFEYHSDEVGQFELDNPYYTGHRAEFTSTDSLDDIGMCIRVSVSA